MACTSLYDNLAFFAKSGMFCGNRYAVTREVYSAASVIPSLARSSS